MPTLLQAAPLQTDLDGLQTALGIPVSIARVVDGQMPCDGGIPDVILVQDIHRHPEVQGHIASILLYGSHHWGLHDVFVEGAQADAPIAISQEPEPASFYTALQEGRLSGAEMAVALEPQSPVQLHGLEDETLYRRNVAAYELVEQLRATALQELQTARFLSNSLDFNTPFPDQQVLLQKMLQLRLKPAEYAAYLREPYKGNIGSSFSEAVHAAEQFYALAEERSEAFMDNLDAGPASSGPQLVVVGGYHTAMMAEALQREGKSYAVLSPNVTQTGYDDLYARSMQQTISALKLQ